MRLASLRDGSRDGALIVVSRSGERYCRAEAVARTLQRALDDWASCAPRLQALADSLEHDGTQARDSATLDLTALGAPLPRAYEWLDGSAFLNHVELVRRARGADIPGFLRDDPLVYQGGSGVLLGPRDDLVLPDPAWGLDYEGEVAVVVTDTPRGTNRERASSAVALLMLVNDVSYRNLIPNELKKGFGFVVSKPATAFAPFAVTPDEFGEAFREGRLHLALGSFVNERRMGETDAGEEMHFSFHDLIAHVCKTRSLTAGTIIGSGTVSNRDRARGVSCLAEQRMLEVLDFGEARTAFLGYGDRVRLELRDAAGRNVFGSIDQKVVPEFAHGASLSGGKA